MSDLFGDYKRPNAEKKVIEKIIKLYEKSKELFKNKNYLEALEGLQNAYQLLLDIWDKYPKVIILYLLMKGYFYTEQYNKCNTTLEQLESMLEYIPREKTDVFIKIKSKILVYQLILFFISDNIDNSIDSIISMIKYLSNHPTFSLVEKKTFFWHYIKSFLKITGITNSNKFYLLKEGFNTMIVEQVNLNDNNGNKDENKNNQNEESKPVKKVNRFMMETYKTFMNSKLRGIIYEILDKEFYYVKYHKINDKVMMFLHKNINIFVRDNNKERLLELFHTFVVLNKTNLKKEYNMTLDELVFEQKRRIEAFDRIFSNLVGAFNHIFRPYFAEELPNLTKRIRRKSNIKNFKININELKNLIKIRIQSPIKDREKEKNKKSKKKLIFKINLNKKNENNNEKDNISINNTESNTNFNFIKEISIPPNTEAMDRQILLDNYITRKNLIKKNLMIQYSNRNNEVNVNKLKKKKIEYNLHLPQISNINDKKHLNLNIKTERNHNYNTYYNYTDNRTLSHRNYKVKQLTKKKTESELENSSKLIDKNNDDTFIIRNINNYLISKIIEHFTSIYNIQHEITTEEKINLSLAYPRKKDIYDFNISNTLQSYGAVSIKGSKTENQDSYFFYNNYFLIKNLTLFGVCDGHGKYGKNVSNLVSTLFPSYLFYILLDDNMIERKIDINKKLLKLLKIQESPIDIKNMFLLRYFFNKFEMDFSLLPLITGNQNILFHQIYESLYYSQKDLKERYELDITNSGTTLCSGLMHGNILYLINLGDSRAILGTYYTRYNKWKTTQLSTDHKPNNPNENKRIIFYKGRVDRFKNQFGEEYGPYRVFGRDNDGVHPGLAVSRSIGDEDAKKLGVIFEPEVVKYELKKQDKILVIGTDGLWEELSNEEVMNIVGNCYSKDIKSEEAANILIDTIQKKIINNDKDEKKNSKNKEDENYNNNDRKERNKDIKKYLDNITCIVIYLDIK